MKALHFAPLFFVAASLLVFVGCNKNDEALCDAVCKKGVVLAKAALTETMKTAEQAVITDALAEWSKQESHLTSLLPACVERCVREPRSSMISCMRDAKALQTYLGCLK